MTFAPENIFLGATDYKTIARQLMADHPDFTIDAIMRDSGFKSAPTFYKVFRGVFGQTPTEYRKTALSDKS